MTLLILGGTREAHDLAARVSRQAIISLAHDLERRPYPVPIRRGGFGGLDAQRDWMVASGIRTVIDASHAFASVISPRTEAICRALHLPYLRLLRPGFVPDPSDHWSEVLKPSDAVALVPANAVVLLTAGAGHLESFAGMQGHVICRTIVPDRAFPFDRGEWLIGAPGSQEDERDLMERLGVTHLVSRNSGGTRGKLDAAAELGVKVILIARPPVPPGITLAETVQGALDWLEGLP
jgi:precorrin-6A/cobalt-precorrin-6A reductase